MLSKSTQKYIRSLRDQKYRQKYHKIVVEGVKVLNDVLNDQLLTVEAIYATESWNPHPIKSGLPEIIRIPDSVLGGISAFSTPQEVLAVCEMPDPSADPKHIQSQLCLYLDGIRDPGNMGTIFRIADWFGIRNVFLSADCVDPYNPKVIQSSMSSLFRVAWSECALHDLLDQPGALAFATTLDGESIYTSALSDKGLIILGNESTGIREPLAQSRVQRISIPSTNRLGADSLNVGVAAGIICAEFRRREVR